MRRSEVLGIVLLSVAAVGCPMSPQPNTHTGDPQEPPWVMNPELAMGMYPGPYIFGVGISQKGLPDATIARRQAEANARQDLGRRLSEFVSSKVNQWSRNNQVGEQWLQTSEVRTMATNISVEYLHNSQIVEYWYSRKYGYYCALSRMKYTSAMLKVRDQVNEIVSTRLRDEKAVTVMRQSLDRELGLDPDLERMEPPPPHQPGIRYGEQPAIRYGE